MTYHEAGKGSAPRKQQDHNAYDSGWDRIFGKKKREEALQEMVSLNEDMGLYGEFNGQNQTPSENPTETEPHQQATQLGEDQHRNDGSK